MEEGTSEDPGERRGLKDVCYIPPISTRPASTLGVPSLRCCLFDGAVVSWLAGT